MNTLSLALLFLAGTSSVCGGSACLYQAHNRLAGLAGAVFLLAGLALLMLFYAQFAGLVS